MRSLPGQSSHRPAAWLSATATLLCLFGARGEAAAATRRVPSDYPTIQAAIDAALPGDEVLVAPGIYSDRTTRTLIAGPTRRTLTALAFLRPGIALRSESGAGATVLDGVDRSVSGVVLFGGRVARLAREGDGPEIATSGSALTAALEGFTIRNTAEGVYAEGVDLSVRENVVESAATRGVSVRESTTGLIQGNTVTNCPTPADCRSTAPVGPAWRGNVFRAGNGSRCTCRSALWSENRFEIAAANLDVIEVTPPSSVTVEGNTFQGWVYCYHGNPIIRGNTIIGPGTGSGLWLEIRQGLIEQNWIENVAGGIVGGTGEIRNNTMVNCGVGINGGAWVHHNLVTNSRFRGMLIGGGGPIEENEVRYSSGIGIWCDSRESVVRRNRVHSNSGHGIAVFIGQILDNVVYANGGDGIRVGTFFDDSPDDRAEPVGTERLIIGNTAVGNAGHGIHLTTSSLRRVERNIAAYNEGSGIVCDRPDYETALCNNAYKNPAGDFAGYCAGVLDRDGNVSLDPSFCDLASFDFRLRAESPCTPENSGGCGLIGALPAICGSPLPVPEKRAVRKNLTPTVSTSWGAIKGSFLVR